MALWPRWVVFAAVVGAAASGLAAQAEPVAAQTTVLNTDSYWRMFLTHRKTVARTAEGQLEETRFSRTWGGCLVSGVSTPLPPDGWNGADFDDSTWKRTRGPLLSPPGKGYEELVFSTMALICARARFEVTDPQSVGDLTLSLAYRGGVVAYLNGKEVARGHLPDPDKKGLEALAEDCSIETFETVDGKPLLEEHRKDPQNAERLDKRVRHLTGIKIPAASLRRGTNVLALELHRSAYPAGKKQDALRWVPIGLVDVELRATGSGIVPNVGRPKGVQVWSHSPSDRVLLTRDYGSAEDPGLRVVKVFGARNGAFPGQIVVSSTEAIRGLKVEPSELKGPGILPAKAIQVRYPRSDSEAGGLRIFQFYQRVKSFDTLDETAPAEVAVPENAEGVAQPIWLTVHVPRDAKPGHYTGTVTVTVDGAAPVRMPLELRVADWTLPEPKDFQTEVGFFESPESVAMKYGLEFWSEQHWQMLDKVFAMMALVGADHVYIPLIRRTHFGNAQSMVRWIRTEGGGYAHDFSIVEKYLDLAIKHLGKPKVVCVVAWDLSDGSRYEATPDPKKWRMPDHGVRITVLDPNSGKLEEAEGPKYGTPEARPFWKPVYDGLVKIMKDRDLDLSTLMNGIVGDCVPNQEIWDDLHAVAPGLKWVSHNHPGARWVLYDKKREEWCGHAAYVYTPAVIDPDEKRFYGWQATKMRLCAFPRWVFDWSCPATYRVLLEENLVVGLMGVARTGFDFWQVIPHAGKAFGRGTLCNRYPENDWTQTSVCAGAAQWVTPGQDGPLSTMRMEMFRSGAQECEARILIEKALVDPATRAKLGEDLATRAQQLLDQRQRLIAILRDESFWSLPGLRWEEDSGELYRLAAEVAKKLAD